MPQTERQTFKQTCPSGRHQTFCLQTISGKIPAFKGSEGAPPHFHSFSFTVLALQLRACSGWHLFLSIWKDIFTIGFCLIRNCRAATMSCNDCSDVRSEGERPFPTSHFPLRRSRWGVDRCACSDRHPNLPVL